MQISIRVKMRKDLNILILDSNTILRKNIINIIKKMGLKGKVYESGTIESAKTFINSEDVIHYFIFDWDLADGSGEDFLKILRDHKDYSDVPIMILTSRNDLSTMVKALEQGASNYVVKPVQIETFIERFQTAYEKHYKDKDIR